MSGLGLGLGFRVRVRFRFRCPLGKCPSGMSPSGTCPRSLKTIIPDYLQLLSESCGNYFPESLHQDLENEI